MIDQKLLKKVQECTDNNEHTKAREIVVDILKPMISRKFHGELRVVYQMIRWQQDRLGCMSEGLMKARQGWDEYVFPIVKETVGNEDYAKIMKCL